MKHSSKANWEVWRIYLCITVVSVLLLGPPALGQTTKYDSQGKQDPFLSLIQAKQDAGPAPIAPAPPLDQRPPGLAGLLISEVTVIGTASSPTTTLVVLKGIDQSTYLAQEGTKLFNGYLDKLNGDDVVFVKEDVDINGKKRVSKVNKRLQTEQQ